MFKFATRALQMLAGLFAGKLDRAVAVASAAAATPTKPLRDRTPYHRLHRHDEFPRGYPGAKLARKAAKGQLARCH